MSVTLCTREPVMPLKNTLQPCKLCTIIAFCMGFSTCRCVLWLLGAWRKGSAWLQDFVYLALCIWPILLTRWWLLALKTAASSCWPPNRFSQVELAKSLAPCHSAIQYHIHAQGGIHVPEHHSTTFARLVSTG